MRAIARLAVRVLGMTSAVVTMSCTAAPQHAAVQRPGFPNSDLPDGNPCVVGSAGAASSGPADAVNRTGDMCGAPFTHGALTSSGQHGFVLKPSGSMAF